MLYITFSEKCLLTKGQRVINGHSFLSSTVYVMFTFNKPQKKATKSPKQAAQASFTEKRDKTMTKRISVFMVYFLCFVLLFITKNEDEKIKVVRDH